MPAFGEGISKDALSDSTTTMICSSLSSSPTATFTSMISAASMSPRSGTFTVSDLLAAGSAALSALLSEVDFVCFSDAFSFCVCELASLVLPPLVVSFSDSESDTSSALSVSSSSSTSSSITASPSLTLSPTFTLIEATLPPWGAGTSTVALSDSSTIIVSSALMVSPTLTLISMISTGSLLPTSGT